MDYKHIHSGRIERWLGTEAVESVSRSMRGWYGPPIALMGVEGAVYATGDGEFIGKFIGGQEATVQDRAREFIQSGRARNANHALNNMPRAFQQQIRQRQHAFASLPDLLQKQRAGRYHRALISKANNVQTGVAVVDRFVVSGTGWPLAGSVGAVAPGGTAYTGASTGAIYIPTAPTSNGWHITNLSMNEGPINGGGTGWVMFYDRLLSVRKDTSITTAEAVTGTFSRYQSATPTDENYAGGNFMMPFRATASGNPTAYNWSVCKYTNQAGTTGRSAPAAAGESAGGNEDPGASALALVGPAGGDNTWFMPLAAGDTGVKALTQIQIDTLSVTAEAYMVVGHPLAISACRATSQVQQDGIISALNLTRIYDNACLTYLAKGLGGQNNVWSVYLDLVSE